MTPNKVAITGHASGVGLALYKHFTQLGCTVQGYDLANGWDLNTQVKDILVDAVPCDLFINNAYCNQIDLAHKWRRLHENRAYTLINISSSIINPVIAQPLIQRYPELELYILNKAELNKISTEINVASTAARSIVIQAGFVDTGFVPNWDSVIREHLPDSTLVRDFLTLQQMNSLHTTEQIVRAVDYALNDASGYVTEVVLDNPKHILSLCK